MKRNRAHRQGVWPELKGQAAVRAISVHCWDLHAKPAWSPQRFYSLSAQIQRERKDYYDVLERTQKGTLDVTGWLSWFLGTLGRAIASAQTTLDAVLAKARFWAFLFVASPRRTAWPGATSRLPGALPPHSWPDSLGGKGIPSEKGAYAAACAAMVKPASLGRLDAVAWPTCTGAASRWRTLVSAWGGETCQRLWGLMCACISSNSM